MAHPEVVHTTAIARTGPMLKIKDLYEEANLRSNIDIIAVIAKIGDMKMTNQSVPAREIYLCDDSWAMIKLIVRDFFAENSDNFKSDQIIYVRNVKPMKSRGYTVLATMPDTLMSHEVQTPEALNLRCWLSQNNLEFKQDGLKDLLFKRFTNLSSLNFTKKSPAGSLENLNKELSQSSQSSNSITVNQINGADDNKNTIDTNVIAERKRRQGEEKDVNFNIKLIKLDLTQDPAKLEGNSTVSDFLTQKVLSDISATKITVAKDSETVINLSDDDENAEEEKLKETVKKEILEKEDSDVEVVDDDKDLIISETYSALMSAQTMNMWNTEKDKYLINFLSKNCKKQLTYDMYLKLFKANQNIFQGLSIDELKNRAETLATAKNYIYLLQLCGGKEIKTEKEKCIFVDRVEQLRKLMRSKEIKEETGN